MDDYEEMLMTKAAWHYYFEGITQQQAAERMGISRMRVIKLLEKARQTGIIQFRLRKDGETRMKMERALIDRYHLKDAFVVPAAASPSSANAAIAEAASMYIIERLAPEGCINIGYGNTPSRNLNILATIAERTLTCVSLTGGVSYYLPDAPSVIMIEGMRSTVTPNPLTVPTASPTASAAAIARGQGFPSRSMEPLTAAAMPRIDPTDTSISPVMITRAMPRATTV